VLLDVAAASLPLLPRAALAVNVTVRAKGHLQGLGPVAINHLVIARQGQLLPATEPPGALLCSQAGPIIPPSLLPAQLAATSPASLARMLLSDSLPAAPLRARTQQPLQLYERATFTCDPVVLGSPFLVLNVSPATVSVVGGSPAAGALAVGAAGGVEFAIAMIRPPTHFAGLPPAVTFNLTCTVASEYAPPQPVAPLPSFPLDPQPFSVPALAVLTAWADWQDAVLHLPTQLRSAWATNASDFTPLDEPLWNKTAYHQRRLIAGTARVPPSATAVFEHTLSGALNVTLTEPPRTELSVGEPLRFHPNTTAMLGGVVLVGEVQDYFSSSITVTSARYGQVCSDVPRGRQCGLRVLTVHPPAMTEGELAAIVAAATSPHHASVGELVHALPRLRVPVSCPPFCPGAAAALVTRQAVGVLGNVTLVPMPVTRGGPLPQRYGGFFYVEQCVGYPDVSSGVCLDAGHPLAPTCAFGAADDCKVCPRGALCPGGYRARPLPGHWSPGESFDTVIACFPPARARCLGWSELNGTSLCGVGYRQGSPACSACDPGYFPDTTGACTQCPSGDRALAVVIPILIFLGALAGLVAVMLVAVYGITKAIGGSTAGGARRVLGFAIWVWVALQTIIQVGRAASTGLPSYLATVYGAVSTLQFNGITVHPACISGAIPFQTEYTQFGVILILMAALVMLQVNYRRYCGCYACGVGRELKPLVKELRKASRRDLASKGADVGAAAEVQPASAATETPASGAAPTTSRLSALVARMRPAARKAPESAAPAPAPVRRRSSVIRAVRSVARSDRAAQDVRSLSCGARMDKAKPMLRRLVFTIMSVLYATVTNTALTTLQCSATPMRVISYLSLEGDGTTLVAAGLRTTYDPDCMRLACSDEAQLTALQQTVTVQVLAGNQAFVCYEGVHRTAAIVAWVVFAAYVLAYPLLTVLVVSRRVRTMLQRGANWSAWLAAREADAGRRAAYIAAASNPLSRAVRRCRVAVFRVGDKYSASQPPSPLALACCRGRSSASASLPHPPPATRSFSGTAVPVAAAASTADAETVPVTSNPLARVASADRAPLVALTEAPPGAAPLPAPPGLRRGAGDDVVAGVNPVHAAATVPSSAAAAASVGGRPARRASAVPARTHIVTADSILDREAAIIADGSLSHFTSSDFRVSRHYFKQIDFAVLFVLSLLLVFWLRPRNRGEAVGKMLVTVAVLVWQGVLIHNCRPYITTQRWKHYTKLYILALATLSAILNFLQVWFAVAEGEPTPQPVVALSVLTFMACIGLLAVLMLSFWINLIRGAQKERRDELARIRAELSKLKMTPVTVPKARQGVSSLLPPVPDDVRRAAPASSTAALLSAASAAGLRVGGGSSSGSAAIPTVRRLSTRTAGLLSSLMPVRGAVRSRMLGVGPAPPASDDEHDDEGEGEGEAEWGQDDDEWDEEGGDHDGGGAVPGSSRGRRGRLDADDDAGAMARSRSFGPNSPERKGFESTRVARTASSASPSRVAVDAGVHRTASRGSFVGLSFGPIGRRLSGRSAGLLASSATAQTNVKARMDAWRHGMGTGAGAGAGSPTRTSLSGGEEMGEIALGETGASSGGLSLFNSRRALRGSTMPAAAAASGGVRGAVRLAFAGTGSHLRPGSAGPPK